ncbi:MAG: hypothetical protein ACD_2C00033G0012 [uncultured bacterium (gcode 4)]|uniref:Uncharacterized protein n=1 Tax=uncultured bacterium (gcode 4) TaxID=1234023 RepID=K2FGC8_9BACT|nr:MAG: hypothetical protein ACD_2C00033G0012 [uncultured bacterium (gcode 4)]
MGKNLREEDKAFLETAKQEWFRAEIAGEVKCSWYYEFAFETPWWHLFSYNEIMFHECQWCIDDENELWIPITDCICTKEQYREKVKRILDLLERDEEGTMKLLNSQKKN